MRITIFVSTALAGKTHKDHFVYCCCCMLSVVVKTVNIWLYLPQIHLMDFNPSGFIDATWKPAFVVVGFFIPVSSLKVFGHSIHSERRRIYLGKSIQALQNDTIIISWLFSFRVIQPTRRWHTFKTFVFFFINSCSS